MPNPEEYVEAFLQYAIWFHAIGINNFQLLIWFATFFLHVEIVQQWKYRQH
jgi:hypothetical protein